MLNKFILQGTIHDIDMRDSGNAMVWIKTSNREDVEIVNAAMPSWYTPVIPVRFSKDTWSNILDSRAKKLNKKREQLTSEDVFEKDATYNLEGSLQGILRLADGKPFYSPEVQGVRIFKDGD